MVKTARIKLKAPLFVLLAALFALMVAPAAFAAATVSIAKDTGITGCNVFNGASTVYIGSTGPETTVKVSLSGITSSYSHVRFGTHANSGQEATDVNWDATWTAKSSDDTYIVKLPGRSDATLANGTAIHLYVQTATSNTGTEASFVLAAGTSITPDTAAPTITAPLTSTIFVGAAGHSFPYDSATKIADSAGSGVSSWDYSVNSGDWVSAGAPNATSVIKLPAATALSKGTIKVRAFDNVGNVATDDAATYNADPTAPTLYLSKGTVTTWSANYLKPTATTIWLKNSTPDLGIVAHKPVNGVSPAPSYAPVATTGAVQAVVATASPAAENPIPTPSAAALANYDDGTNTNSAYADVATNADLFKAGGTIGDDAGLTSVWMRAKDTAATPNWSAWKQFQIGVDTQAPVVTMTDLGAGKWYSGSSITVPFTAKDHYANVGTAADFSKDSGIEKVVGAGQAGTSFGDSNGVDRTAQGSIIVTLPSSGCSTDSNSTVYYWAKATDNAGNENTTNLSGKVRYDQNAPTVVITGVDDKATVTSGSIDKTYTVTVAGDNVSDRNETRTLHYNFNGTGWKTKAGETPGGASTDITFTVKPSDAVNGRVAVEYYASDDAVPANSGVHKSFTLNYVTTTPVTTITGGGDTWYGNSGATLSVSATGATGADVSTYYKIKNPGTASTFGSDTLVTGGKITVPATQATEGVNTIRYYSRDNFGNIETARELSVKIDATAPQLTVSKKVGTTDAPAGLFSNEDAGGSYLNGTLDFGFTATDALSGMDKVEYKVDNATEWTTGTAVSVPAGGTKEHKVMWRALDKAGNITSGSQTWHADSDAPVITVTAITWNVNGGTPAPIPADKWLRATDKYTLAFTLADPRGTNLDGTALDGSGANGSNVTPTFGAGSAGSGFASGAEQTIDTTDNGTLSLSISDNAVSTANKGTVEVPSVRADGGNPTVAAASEMAASSEATVYSNGAFRVLAKDTASGIAKVSYRFADTGDLTDVAATPLGALSFTYDIPLAGVDGDVVKVYAAATDVAGNAATVDEKGTVTLDKTAPVTTVQGAEEGVVDYPVNLFFEAEDAGSGVAYTEYNINGAGWKKLPVSNTLPFGKDGKYTVQYRSVDNAKPEGNVETAKTTVVQINRDKVGPRTYAKSVRTKRYAIAKLPFMAIDDKSSTVKNFKFVVKDSKNKIVARMSISGTKKANFWYYKSWKATKRGTFRYYVYAQDAAGNNQRSIGSALITVR